MIDILEIWALKRKKNSPAEFFDEMDIDDRLDREVLVAEIMRQCGALTPIYNTTDSFEYFTKAFFKREKDTIKKMIDTTQLEYNPLENFERKEKLKHVANENTATDETNINQSNSTTTEEEKTSAYNEDLYQPINQTTGSNETSGKEIRDYDRKRDFTSNDDNSATGINGLTTRQDLILKERKVVDFNIYKWIVEKYECEYFLAVY